MVLFLGVTALTLLLAYFCYNEEQVQLNMERKTCSQIYAPKGMLKDTGNGSENDPGKDRLAVGRITRQEALNRFLCVAIFVVLAALSVCRIASGNDYWGYVLMFDLISQGREVASEAGFNGVVLLMQELFGKEQYLPIFGLFSLLTVFFFVKTIYDQGEWFVFSLFLFLANGYYFSSFNSVRYYFGLGIAMFSMKYVIRGEYGKFILWILAASLFHKSILVVIPGYLLAGYLSVKLKKWHIIAGGILVISLFLCRDLYREIIFTFYPYYEGSQFDHVNYSITNIGKCAGTLILAAVTYKTAIRDNIRNRFYLYLTIGGSVLYTAGAFIPEVSRIGYYFVISQIFLIPNMLKSMERGIWKNLFTAGVVIAFSAHFILFLKTAYSVDIRLLPYLNWIFN